MTVILVLVTLVAFLAADHMVQRYRTRKVGAAVRACVSSMVEAFKQIPEGIQVALNHTWVKGEAGSVVTVGLDEFVSKFFGTVEQIILPDADMAADRIILREGDRSVALLCPVKGRVVAVNGAALRDPSSVHDDPYGNGWLFRIQAENGPQRAALVPGKATEWLKEQVAQAREFFLQREEAGNYALMQDGGTVVDGVMKLYGPGLWDEFGDRFLK